MRFGGMAEQVKSAHDVVRKALLRLVQGRRVSQETRKRLHPWRVESAAVLVRWCSPCSPHRLTLLLLMGAIDVACLPFKGLR